MGLFDLRKRYPTNASVVVVSHSGCVVGGGWQWWPSDDVWRGQWLALAGNCIRWGNREIIREDERDWVKLVCPGSGGWQWLPNEAGWCRHDGRLLCFRYGEEVVRYAAKHVAIAATLCDGVSWAVRDDGYLVIFGRKGQAIVTKNWG